MRASLGAQTAQRGRPMIFQRQNETAQNEIIIVLIFIKCDNPSQLHPSLAHKVCIASSMMTDWALTIFFELEIFMNGTNTVNKESW